MYILTPICRSQYAVFLKLNWLHSYIFMKHLLMGLVPPNTSGKVCDSNAQPVRLVICQGSTGGLHYPWSLKLFLKASVAGSFSLSMCGCVCACVLPFNPFILTAGFPAVAWELRTLAAFLCFTEALGTGIPREERTQMSFELHCFQNAKLWSDLYLRGVMLNTVIMENGETEVQGLEALAPNGEES